MKYAPVFFICSLMLMSCVAKNQPAIQYQARDYFILMNAIQLMEMDHLGNIYIADEKNRVNKFDSTGLLQYNVVNNSLGDIHSMDVGNPFKIMLFYRDQQTILLLDNTLSEIQRFRLANWQLQDVTAACLSPDNALWLFDGTKNTLIKMNHAGMPIQTSDPFDIIRPPSARPDYIYDTDHFLILKEQGKPIAVFNDFGNYLNSLPFDDELFSFMNDRIIRTDGTSLAIYNLPEGEIITSIDLKEGIGKGRVMIYRNQLYGVDEKGVWMVPFSVSGGR